MPHERSDEIGEKTFVNKPDVGQSLSSESNLLNSFVNTLMRDIGIG